MKPNTFERIFFQNNPVRVAGQRHYEAPLLQRLGGTVDGGRALELGCGRGFGIDCILERFRAAEVVGIDIDEAAVVQASDRHAGRRDQVHVRWGDMTAIDEPDGSFDAVFAFQTVHHTPWQKTLADVARVLRPGARFYFFEPTRKTLARWPARAVFDHPGYGLFGGDEFCAGMAGAGMDVGDRQREVLSGVWIAGVGVRG